MTVTETQVTWLTQEAHDRLKGELDELIANRTVIAAEINACLLYTSPSPRDRS